MDLAVSMERLGEALVMELDWTGGGLLHGQHQVKYPCGLSRPAFQLCVM